MQPSLVVIVDIFSQALIVPYLLLYAAVKALQLAVGLGMIRPGVYQDDVACKQFLLKEGWASTFLFSAFFLPFCPTKHEPLSDSTDAGAPNLLIASLSVITAFSEAACSNSNAAPVMHLEASSRYVTRCSPWKQGRREIFHFVPVFARINP